MTERLKMVVLTAVALVCRLPFLGEGYGKEFDAWSNALNARIISETGVYEVSRLPGHPLQELLLSGLWPLNHSYFFFNLLSALISALAVWAFYDILKRHQIGKALNWALAFNFLPVFFIAGTYTIDYNFALAFILLAYRGVLKEDYLLAGIFIGLATGFRISSLAFGLPFLLLIGIGQWQLWLKMGLAALLVSILAFWLPISTYGAAFLDFHKPPFPGWASVLYKLSFGIWGLPLLLLLGFSLPQFFKKLAFGNSLKHLKGLPLAGVLILIIGLQLVVFMRLPFKSEFFIPALPFILIYWAQCSSDWVARWVPYFALSSLLFFGFDYLDPWRGSAPQGPSFSFNAGSKTIFCDVLQGPVLLDKQKRKVKSQTVERAILALKEEDSSWVIAGWYWPELVFKYPESNHIIDHYSTAEEILKAKKSGLRILYLPEIERQNSLMHPNKLAEQLGKPLLQP